MRVQTSIKPKLGSSLIAVLEAGAAVNAVNNAGVTALMHACNNGHDLCAHALLENGAAVDAVDEAEWTALMYSCQNGHERCTHALLEAGAAVDATDENGGTALMKASSGGHERCAHALLGMTMQSSSASPASRIHVFARNDGHGGMRYARP